MKQHPKSLSSLPTERNEEQIKCMWPCQLFSVGAGGWELGNRYDVDDVAAPPTCNTIPASGNANQDRVDPDTNAMRSRRGNGMWFSNSHHEWVTNLGKAQPRRAVLSLHRIKVSSSKWPQVVCACMWRRVSQARRFE